MMSNKISLSQRKNVAIIGSFDPKCIWALHWQAADVIGHIGK